jgi:putative ABC transport system permease protein
LLTRLLPPGKRGASILGDLHEEFRHQSSRWWYWQQTIRLSLRYAISASPQQRLSYPRRSGMFFELSSDIRTAARNFTRAPGTSALIVLTLALAIGAATIGFTFADFALLRGLPVDDGSKVVSVFMSDGQGSNPRARVSGPDFLDLQARSTKLEKMAAFRDGRAPLIRNGRSQTITVSYATAELFESMGQHPVAGRALMSGDDRPGAPPVVVLAHRFWQSEFAGREGMIGQTLQIGPEHHTVVGVLSPDLEVGNIAEIDVWLPLRIDPEGPRDVRNLRFLARLKDGVAFDEAAAEMASIGASLATEHPRTNGGWTVRLVPISDLIGGEGFWVVIALFLLSIGLLMAIATANVSNLVMVRMVARARELAVRTALGARKGRLVRQLITEGALLSLAAGLLAFPVAWAGLRGISAISAEQVFTQLRVDSHEMLFVSLLVLICPIVFTLAPMRALARPDMRQVLAAGGTRDATASSRGRGILVVVQVALAVILLTVSTLALRSIRNIYAVPIGIETSRLLIFGLEFDEVQYPDVAQARAAADATRTELGRVGGVEGVAMLSGLPVLGDTGPVALTIDNVAPQPTDARPTAVVTGSSADAARVTGLAMRAGSWWPDGARDVAVVSEALARRHLGGVDRAIGRFVSFSQGDRVVEARVVGVSSDVANTDRTEEPPARLWVPLSPGARRFSYVVRSDRPAALATDVRTIVAAQAAAVPIDYLETFDAALEDAASSDYAVVGMLAGFAVLALVLATTGLFGVVSYTVAQRTAEFGTRMALGARAGDVVGLVARDSMKLLSIGLAIGLLGGVAVASTMTGLLYGLSPLDPATLAGVSALLAVVTLIATALPAWKAARIDPVVALRIE